MKRIIAIVLSCSLVFLLSANAFATENDSPTIELFTYTNEQGELVRMEIWKYEDHVITYLYIDDLLSQMSTGCFDSDTITTYFYDATGIVVSTSDIAISSMHNVTTGSILNYAELELQPIEPEYSPNFDEIGFGPGDGGGGNPSFPPRNVMDEPIDNTGLSYSHRMYSRDYYYLGSSVINGTTAKLYRSFESRYIGDTHYFNWGAGTANTVISTMLAIVFPSSILAYVVNVLINYGAEVLAYATSVEIATYEHDYNYAVSYSGRYIFETFRYYTYWHMAKIVYQGTTPTTVIEYIEKSYDDGTPFNNIELLNYAVTNYG